MTTNAIKNQYKNTTTVQASSVLFNQSNLMCSLCTLLSYLPFHFSLAIGKKIDVQTRTRECCNRCWTKVGYLDLSKLTYDSRLVTMCFRYF